MVIREGNHISKKLKLLEETVVVLFMTLSVAAGYMAYPAMNPEPEEEVQERNFTHWRTETVALCEDIRSSDYYACYDHLVLRINGDKQVLYRMEETKILRKTPVNTNYTKKRVSS